MNKFKFYISYNNLVILLKKLINKLYAKNFKPVNYSNYPILDIKSYISEKNKELYRETLGYEKIINKIAYDKLFNVKLDIGYRFSKSKGEMIGGGAYELIYYLSRQFKPETYLETGVGAGFITHSILTAIQKNNLGNLYSSDFPYYKVKNAESYIGILLDIEQKKNFNIYIQGDRFNLPKIIKKISHIDLIHYDSDKSYTEKQWFFNYIKPYISSRSIIVIDDIQDDRFFLDYVKANNIEKFEIFQCDNKFVGVINNH